MTVGELSERLTAVEENSWLAYYREDPFGSYRDDLRSAQIAQLIHNVNSKKPRKLEDFMLFRTAEKRQVSDNIDQDVRNVFAKVNAIAKGKKNG